MTTNNDSNELNALIGAVLRIDVTELRIPLYGRLIEVLPYWIVIEKRDGQHRMISRGRIVGIETVGGPV
ncbi:MAG: hypothetical protein QG591_2573 [Planctomycetota bacterium]|nr:hypothetical protein [Planctomycetota bacterium]